MIPDHERRILEAHVRGCRLSHLAIKQQERALNEYEVSQLKELLEQRDSGIPLQYLTGSQDFYGRDFYVNTCVLVPRPETEGLVELALSCLPPKSDDQKRFALDFGTGSGCISITLGLERKDLTVFAVDSSKEALEVAIENARKLRVPNVDFFNVSEEPVQWQFDHIPRLDLLISNPPYLVEEDEIADDVRNHEPPEALFSPTPDPLYFYKFLAELFEQKAHEHSIGAFEIAEQRGPETAKLFEDRGCVTEIHKDLTGRDRYLIVRLNKKPPVT